MANPFYAPKVLNKTYRKANNCHPVELKIFRYIIERVYLRFPYGRKIKGKFEDAGKPIFDIYGA